MEITDKNSTTIANELNWLEEVISTRIKLYFNDEPPYANIEEVPVPLPEKQSYYADTITTLALSIDERLILALAIAPYIKPQLLDVFYTKNALVDKPFTEFGGIHSRNHPGFIPTTATVLFILAGGNTSKKINVLKLLKESVLFSGQSILRLSPAEPYEPSITGVLTITDEYLNNLVLGKNNKPDFNAFFPARLIDTEMNWDDLVLGHDILNDILEIKAWIENGHILMNDPGIRKKLKPGYRSLFYGPPGTGKTLTACLLGKETNRDVYRIDLSMIVSKYIGETEKNLSNVFDQAKDKNWVLFFDEADALFGKRTTTSSSNDRYANQEVSYLLQRIEDFPGVVILASNFKSNIDEAFSRRFQSMIHFPMPDQAERLLLWQNAFSSGKPLHASVNLNSIAEKYALSGGAIINILRYCNLNAIRNNNENISTADIILAIRKELQKEGKTA